MRSDRGERVLTGLPISPGIAIGPAFIGDDGAIHVPEYRVTGDEVAVERKRLADAVALSLKQLAKLKLKAAALPAAAAEEAGYLLDAHVAMLTNSRLVRGSDRRIAEERLNAERAVAARAGPDRLQLRGDGRRLSGGARRRYPRRRRAAHPQPHQDALCRAAADRRRAPLLSPKN